MCNLILIILETTIYFEGAEYKISAYRMVFLLGFVISLIGLLLVVLFYRETESDDIMKRHNNNCCQQLQSVLKDKRFWLFLFFSMITVGMKMLFNMLSLLLPRILIGELGQEAPFGLLISLCPFFVVIFLFLTAPCTLNLRAYTQITIGAFFTTLSPVILLFGHIDYRNMILFIALLSLGESLSSPKMYEVTFEFATKGREGMFLALTAAPFYLTMAFSGYASGYLLEKYYPVSGES